MRVPQHQSDEDEIAAARRKPALLRSLFVVALLCITLAGVGAAITGANADKKRASKGESEKTTVRVAAKRFRDDSGTDASAPATEFSVEIRKPSGPPRVVTGLSDVDGNVVTVACSTCHTTRQPNHQNRTARDLDEFHGGTVFSHGTVSCLSCHNERDYDALKLADGNRVEFSDVMTLCAQCHGPQMKAYEHGAHGGMSGYWDSTRGPRMKNNCIDCHNPHTPQFPKMQPTFKPKDRFLEAPRTEH
ncbi:MAG: hypothetical protein O2856_08960 [Planctomycetota bacterium]|nr:hypothetical protein [Planctomycetota bacterium]